MHSVSILLASTVMLAARVRLGNVACPILVATCMHAQLLQLCPTLCNPMNCGPQVLCPWDSPGKNTGVDCHTLLQRIFPKQGLNPGLLHCRKILYHLSYREVLAGGFWWRWWWGRWSCLLGTNSVDSLWIVPTGPWQNLAHQWVYDSF